MFSEKYSELRHNPFPLHLPYDDAKAHISQSGPGSLGLASLLYVQNLGEGGDIDHVILNSSKNIKSYLYNQAVYAISPLYVTSFCNEHCLYCNYRAENKSTEVTRIRLTESQLQAEIEFLVHQKGFRVIELVYASDPRINIDSICHHIKLAHSVLSTVGGGVVGLNAEPFDVSGYQRLLQVGLDFAVVWQETYNKERYELLHPGKTTKASFEHRLDVFDRMLKAGLKYFGMGVLSGLSDWRADWNMLMQHEHYLFETYGEVPSILGLPRLKPAKGAEFRFSTTTPSNAQLRSALAIHNLYSPNTLAFVNTRENFELCVSLAQGGGCLFTLDCSTIPGGYVLGTPGYQFPTGTFDSIKYAPLLCEHGLDPVFAWDFKMSHSFEANIYNYSGFLPLMNYSSNRLLKVGAGN